jgi:hypothetical protein
MRKVFSKTFLVTSAAIVALYASPPRADEVKEAKLTQTNLVSDIPMLATITDDQLHNPWGVSHSPTSPFWVSNQGKSTATLYNVTDETNVSKVNINPPTGFVLIPKTTSGPQGPTGQVNNTFPVGNGGDGKPALFIFANLNGTISAWDRGPARRPLSRSRLLEPSTPGWRSTAHRRGYMPPTTCHLAASTSSTAPSDR